MADKFKEAIKKIEKAGQHYKEKDSKRNFEGWLEATSRYTKLKKKSIVDLIIDASNLLLIFNDQKDETLDPLLEKAIAETNPNFDFLNPPNGEQLKGAINSAKGKYFEYLVAEKLNNGERVGDVILPEGFSAKVAEKINQPGWDIEIIDQNGDSSNYIQLKATDSLSYIKSALDKYPDFQILTTDEVGDFASDSNFIFDSDISNEWLESEVEKGLIDNVNYGETFWDNFQPIYSLSLILATEGYRVVVKKKDIKNAFSSFVSRSSKSLITIGISSFLQTIGTPDPLSFGTAMITRYVLEKADFYETLKIIISERREEMIKLRLLQQDLYLLRGK